MCNGYPVVRCAGYGRALIRKGENMLGGASTFEEQEEAHRVIREGEDVFYSTPTGFRVLEKQYDGLSDGVERDRVWNRLIAGRQRRKEQVRASNLLQLLHAPRVEAASELIAGGAPKWLVGAQMGVDWLVDTQEGVGEPVEHEGLYGLVVPVGGVNVFCARNEFSFKFYRSYESGGGESFWDEPKPDPLNPVERLVRDFQGRGEGQSVYERELTVNQRVRVREVIVEHLVNEFGFGGVMLCAPTVGVLQGASLRDDLSLTDPKIRGVKVWLNSFEDLAEFTLHTPMVSRNGTEPLGKKQVSQFKNTFRDLIEEDPEIVKGKTVVNLKNGAKKEDFPGFLLKPLKGNFFEVRKLGRVRGETTLVTLRMR